HVQVDAHGVNRAMRLCGLVILDDAITRIDSTDAGRTAELMNGSHRIDIFCQVPANRISSGAVERNPHAPKDSSAELIVDLVFYNRYILNLVFWPVWILGIEAARIRVPVVFDRDNSVALIPVDLVAPPFKAIEPLQRGIVVRPRYRPVHKS